MIAGLYRVAQSRWFALIGFVLGHVWLAWYGARSAAYPMGDINFAYLPWVGQMLQSNSWFGINQPWVYPYPDLIFMFWPHWFPVADYQTSWLVMATTIDVLAASVLLFWRTANSRWNVLGLWFWTLAQLLLGPVSISRLDSISVAVALVGVLVWLRSSSHAAAAWFAVATWIKVWPVAMLAATVTQAKNFKSTALWGAGVGLVVAIGGIALGGWQNLFSFVLKQTDRGIQIESPWATPWLWGHIHKLPGWGLYYSNRLQTFQVKGPLATEVSHLLGPVFYGALAITLILGWLAVRGVADGNLALRHEVFAWTILTGILDLIVFNKVGSPQYYGWLIVPAVLGLIQRVPGWRIVLTWLVVMLGLTGLIYPVLYGDLLSGQELATAILGFRNLAALGLLVLANWRLTELVLEQSRKKRTD